MLGSKLKQAREARQLSLREIEWATKIRADYLQALEDEQFDRLPSATHARGFLRAYARYLDLDPDPLVDEYNHAAAQAKEIVSTRPAVKPRRRQVAVTPGMIVGAALMVLIAVFGFYLYNQFKKYEASRAADAAPTPRLNINNLPSPSPVLSPSPSPSPSPTGVVLVLRVDAPTWLQVDVDGQPSPETTSAGKIYAAGTQLSFTATRSVHVISGKAAHTFVNLNGQDLGTMPPAPGGSGAANKTYTRTA